MQTPYISELLGERSPSESANRRAIRKALAERLNLNLADHDAVWARIAGYLKWANGVRQQLATARVDFERKRQALARITAAVILASDDEGRHLQRLRRVCLGRVNLQRSVPLLPLALKAFGPYAYNVPARRRAADKEVSRDFNGIKNVLKCEVLPVEFIKFWKEEGHGLDECSRGFKSKARRTAIVKSRAGDGRLWVASIPNLLAKLDALPIGAKALALISKTGNAVEVKAIEVRPDKVAHFLRRPVRPPPLKQSVRPRIAG